MSMSTTNFNNPNEDSLFWRIVYQVFAPYRFISVVNSTNSTNVTNNVTNSDDQNIILQHYMIIIGRGFEKTCISKREHVYDMCDIIKQKNITSV